MTYLGKNRIKKKVGGTALTVETNLDINPVFGTSDTLVKSEKAIKEFVETTAGGGGTKKAMSIAATF